jgi:hypothetical protein
MPRHNSLLIVLLFMIAACSEPTPTPAPTSSLIPTPEPGPSPAALPAPDAINLDRATQTLIAHAKRAIFLVPFSHWDTDWHRDFAVYAAQADRNILDAIRIAKHSPRFRYTIEQVLFAQHFWQTHPEYQADLAALVRNHQFTFAWAGITQPDTSLVAPAIQLRNLQLGQDWLGQIFGVQAHTAWQSDAFGNSAALPSVLARSGIPYLYMGRGRGLSEQRRRESLFPHAFYWASPADPTQRVLVAYVFYSDAWGPIYQLAAPQQQLAELRKIADREFGLTRSKYIFLPMGADISSPLPTLPDLVERWNAADPDTAMVMADPATAFQYLATQPLPQYTTDVNPIWQGFYGTRPEAKIADKESEYYLTAADKFGLLTDAPQSTAWYTAALNAHYDNIAGVGLRLDLGKQPAATLRTNRYQRCCRSFGNARADCQCGRPATDDLQPKLLGAIRGSRAEWERAGYTGYSTAHAADRPQSCRVLGRSCAVGWLHGDHAGDRWRHPESCCGNPGGPADNSHKWIGLSDTRWRPWWHIQQHAGGQRP